MAAHSPLLAGATLLLLLSLSHSQSLITAEDDDLVLDREGNPLEVDSEYYILPVGSGYSGELTTSATWLPCPLYVIQSKVEPGNGKAVKFIPTDSTHTQIHLSSDLTIDSGFDAFCRGDGLWKLTFNEDRARLEVVANGAYGIFSPAKLQIRKGGSSGAYVLSHCSHVTLRLRQDQCKDFGIFTHNSKFKVLGLPATGTATDGALEVVFLKKENDDNLAHRAAH